MSSFTLILLAIMIAGILIGYYFREKRKLQKITDKLIMIAIYLLLFFIGIDVGGNKTIISNLGKLGLDALILSIGAIIGSVVFAYLVYKFFFEKKIFQDPKTEN